MLAVIAAACTESTADTTTTLEPVGSLVPGTTSTTLDSALNLALPLDPNIKRGVLDNGLTYYVASNDSPGERVELRLLVDAGSVQEDADQSGMAHFLEHMMFNGTERFPRNELTDVLEAFGPRFGPDINAYTSFDETVYELSLTTEDELIDLGLAVLREWASRATLTETDVVEERGIVLDEWRLRAQGFSARVFDELQALVLEGSAYEGRLPIGTPDSISTTTPDALGRFYKDWYRPERMAVVAVGDFDVDEFEERIRETFSDLVAEGDSRLWEDPVYSPPLEPRYGSLVDAEAAAASLTAVWPIASRELLTAGDYQNRAALGLALQILADRLNEDSLTDDSPLVRATAADVSWARAVRLLGLDVEVRANRAREGIEATLIEIERMRQFGVTTAEFERAMGGYTAVSEQVHSQRESRQDLDIADQITSHHLGGGDLLSPDQRFELERGIATRLTRDDLTEALVQVLDGVPVIFAVGPDDSDVEIPDELTLAEIYQTVPNLTLERRSTPDDEPEDLMARPPGSSVVSQERDPRFEFTTVTYENGATVYLWESDIAIGGIYGLVEGFGGTSVFPVGDITEAELMVELVSRSGLRDFDTAALQRVLSDELAFVEPFVTETRQGLEVEAAVDDAETMFQLINLHMTAPRIEAAVVDSVVSEYETLITSKDELPEILFAEAVNDAYYGPDPRYRVVPTAADIADLDPDLALSLYTRLFGNAADFGFAFVGDFETDEMIELASSYIGSLPGSSPGPGYVDNQPFPPREIQLTTVEAGVGQQGQLGMFFTNEMSPVFEDRVTARLTELILNARLRDRIREELGSTYSISSSLQLQRDPDDFIEASVISTGPPEGLDIISEEILIDIEDLQNNGPTDGEFATALEQLRDEYELIDNELLAVGLITAHLYPDQPVVQLAERYPTIDLITPEDVTELAKRAFDPAQRIEVRQVPRP